MFDPDIFRQFRSHIVQFNRNDYNAPNLVKILNNEKIAKIFHYGREHSTY